jgi:ferritin-like protein
MSEASAALHEAPGRLRDETLELHRALVSLQEELQAIDWYRQRADACRDDALRAILEHNLDEEIEHAAMLLEWLRRNHATFAAQFDVYLDSSGPITGVEAAATAAETAPEAAVDRTDPHAGCAFTIGSMKEQR